MSVSPPDLEYLRKQLEAKRKLLEEEERALKIVEAMFRREAFKLEPDAPAPPPLAIQPSGGFAQAVRDAAQGMSDEFTVVDVEAELVKKGVKLPPKNARARIAMVMQEMVERQTLERTFRGTGSIPHRFKSISVF